MVRDRWQRIRRVVTRHALPWGPQLGWAPARVQLSMNEVDQIDVTTADGAIPTIGNYHGVRFCNPI